MTRAHRISHRRAAAHAAGLVILASGCAQRAPLPEPLPPPLPIMEVAQTPMAPPATVVAPGGPGTRITMTAANAPLREMLPIIAEAAGVSLVVHPEVTGRVSFHFEDVPAVEALARLAEEAGYELGTNGGSALLPYTARTVFFRPAVNLDYMDVRGIRERFRVGQELAEWVVLSRPWRR